MATGRKILMIDDDVNLVGVFRLVCTAKGYEFFAAHSAGDADYQRRVPRMIPRLRRRAAAGPG